MTDTFDADKQTYEYVAEQISREDGLIHNRMIWTLQLNGFLFAALALLKNPADGKVVDTWLGALPAAGLALSVFGWLGVIGANFQLNYLTSIKRDARWPGPYGDRHAFLLGNIPTHFSLGTLTVLWLWLFAHRVWPDAVERFSTATIRWLQQGGV